MKNLKEYILTENNFFKNLGIGQVKFIKEWLDEHKIKNYTINSDLTIDVNGTVDLYKFSDKELPNYIQFRKVTRNFYIYDCPNLETLKGCPKEVGWTFSCSGCLKLESLEGCPQKVGIDFYCSFCPKLESLEGCPQKVGVDFRCYKCGKQFTKDDVKKVCKVNGKIMNTK